MHHAITVHDLVFSFLVFVSLISVAIGVLMFMAGYSEPSGQSTLGRNGCALFLGSLAIFGICLVRLIHG